VPRFIIRDLVLERIAHRLLKEISEPGATRLRTEELAQELASTSFARIPTTVTSSAATARIRWPPASSSGRGLRRLEPPDRNVVAGYRRGRRHEPLHFAKAFKQTTGRTPHQFLTDQRLLHARSLLHDERLSIGQIASAVGLSHSHFTAVFTREMG